MNVLSSLSKTNPVFPQQFRTHMLAHYRYQDNRLAFANVSPSRINIQGEERLRDRIWVPHLVLRNERRTQIMGLESKDTFVSINPKGEVIFSYRMSATIYCWMDLKKFPFDMQTCNINMVSCKYLIRLSSTNFLSDAQKEHVHTSLNNFVF